jgi:uncharacterized protein (TIGR03437 family)
MLRFPAALFFVASLAFGQTPTIDAIFPPSAAVGTTNLTLTVTGANYSADSRIVFRYGALNAVALNTLFAPPNQLTASVPGGLLADPSTVTIAVTRTVGGTVLVSNLVAFTVTEGFSIQTPCPLANGVVNTPYSATLTAAGGAPPYAWSIVGGALPPGLGLTSNGVVAGTPTVVVDSSFILRATDASGRTATQPCSLRVLTAGNEQTLFITSVNPNAVVAGSGDTRVEIRGLGFLTGVTAVLTSPEGTATDLATTFFSAALLTAVIPRALLVVPGSYTIGVKQPVLTRFQFSNVEAFTVAGPLQFGGSCPLVDGGVGTPYQLRLSATGGFPPYRFAITEGALAPGLSLAEDGSISGSATAAGTFSFGVAVVDSRGNTLSRACAVRILGPLSASPAEVSFTVPGGAPSSTREVSLVTAAVGAGLTATVATQAGGNWLRATLTAARTPALARIAVDSANLAQGTYQGTVTINTDGATNRTIAIPVRLVVGPVESAALVPRPGILRFFTARSARVPPAQGLLVANPSPTPLGFSATPGASWLSVSPQSGTASSAEPARLVVRVNPTGFEPGTYRSEVVLVSGVLRVAVPVTLSVAFSPEVLNLSRSGLAFTAVAGGPPPDARQSHVLGGSNEFFFEVEPPAGFVASPAADSSRPGLVSVVAIAPSDTSLGVGVHQFESRISAQAADNPVRYVSTTLTLLPSDSSPPPVPDRASLVFPTAATTGRLALRNLAREAKGIDVQLNGDARVWNLADSPRTAASGQSRSVEVSVNSANAPPGVTRSSLAIQGAGAGSVQLIELLLFAPPQGCQATRLELASLSLVGNFTVGGGLSEDLEFVVYDNCGNQLSSANGMVTVQTPHGYVTLTNLRDGRWVGTWQVAQSTAGPAELVAYATDGTLSGSLTVRGSITGSTLPIITQDVATLAGFGLGPIAVGGAAGVFGQGLATSALATSGYPLSTRLGDTQLLIGDRQASLYYASPTQVNAQFPYQLRQHVAHEVAVRVGNRISNRVEVAIAAAQPSVFSVVDAAGLAPNAGNPTRAGQTLSIFCEGLGLLDQAVEAGVAAPASPPALTLLTPIVTIGGRRATVQFSGLLPTVSGIYQINADVPEGVSGDNLPLVVTLGGLSSQTVPIAVR